jgi:hypothetical protein
LRIARLLFFLGSERSEGVFAIDNLSLRVGKQYTLSGC